MKAKDRRALARAVSEQHSWCAHHTKSQKQVYKSYRKEEKEDYGRY